NSFVRLALAGEISPSVYWGLAFASAKHWISISFHWISSKPKTGRSDMSRYRPPAKPVSNYITPEGEKNLSDELNQLWRIERPQVTQQVSEAAAMGDRSENAEYI